MTVPAGIGLATVKVALSSAITTERAVVQIRHLGIPLMVHVVAGSQIFKEPAATDSSTASRATNGKSGCWRIVRTLLSARIDTKVLNKQSSSDRVT